MITIHFLFIKFQILFYTPEKLFLEALPKLCISILIMYSEYIFSVTVVGGMRKTIKFRPTVQEFIFEDIVIFNILRI